METREETGTGDVAQAVCEHVGEAQPDIAGIGVNPQSLLRDDKLLNEKSSY
jgi:hypothetical protein